jgi:integrase
MKTASSKERTRGSNQIRKVQRYKGEFWGYDVWLRQPDGTRTRYREFSFSSKAEAGQALAALKTSGWKARYGLKPPPTVAQTTISSAIASYLKVAKANLAANRTDDSKYWRNMPGHMRTLERWGEFAGLERHVSTIQSDDFVFWMAAEMERGKTNRQALKKATIRRGLNTIRAALNHAVQTCSDLRTYKVPRSPLTKKSEEERDRVLADEEISKISVALSSKGELADALFFFRIALITGGRMAEILRMKWEESSERFGTVKLYSSKTQKWRTIKAPAAATLIAQRRMQQRNAPMVIDRPDHWIRGVLQTASESVGVVYGQQVPGGWCPHDLRHTCLTNLALAGVPLNGIKEYAGHSSIVETQRYLKFMPESIELAAMVTSRLAELTRTTAESPQAANGVEDPDSAGSSVSLPPIRRSE